MHCVTSLKTLRKKHRAQAGAIDRAMTRLGPIVDIEGMNAEQAQAEIARLPKRESVCLIGGYDLVPTFVRDNPTAHLDSDDDKDIHTDAPYGAAVPGVVEDEYVPDRVVARIPDGAHMKAHEFLAILETQTRAPRTRTPKGTYEEAAEEFAGAANEVRKAIAANGTTEAPVLSPPSRIKRPDPASLLTRRGRVHILLHGADKSPDWSSLWGRGPAERAPFVKALSTGTIAECDLKGAIVTFSSCYAAMLDGGRGRSPKNQVALACLARGAKIVVGSTRSNWIATQPPYDELGPALIGRFWIELRKPGATAGAAFVRAKRAFLRKGLAGDRKDRPYLLKTVLQANLYGHPGTRL